MYKPIATPTALLNTEEAARVLGIAPTTLATWRCTGRVPLPYVKIGRRVGYRPADLERFLDASVVEVGE